MNQIFLIGTLTVSMTALLCSVIFHKSEIFFQFLLRLTMGVAGIYFINTILGMFNIESGVGINGTTMFAAGTLGLPGIMMMFGVSFYLLNK